MRELIQQQSAQTRVNDPLKVAADASELRKELNLIDPDAVKAEEADAELVRQAENYASQLVSIDPKDLRGREERRAAVEGAGRGLQADLAGNAMLKEQVKNLAKRGADGGEVANALMNLKIQVEGLDPHQWDFAPGWMSRWVSVTPFAGKKLQRYFTKYESAQTVIEAIMHSLEKGRHELTRDNKTLLERQINMRESTYKLERLVKLLQLVDKNLEDKLAEEQNPERQKFVKEELLFTLRQTIMDRQQDLAVNQQGVLTFEIIIRNNRELIRGVQRANSVTVRALDVAVTTCFALTHQRIVLDKITAVNATTSNLIAENARLLKTQGVEIHKQSSSAMLEMDKLKSAFADIHAAMEDISRFRTESLGKMANTILELDQMTTEAEKRIKKMEEGDRVAPALTINVE